MNKNSYLSDFNYSDQSNMEKERKKYRFLVIGKMGEGKSSLCRFLTGNSSIEVSSKINSCTSQSKAFQSTDGFKDQRGVDIEVIDTPGLDSKEENLFQIVIDLATSLSKFPEINGILYVISMANKRDEYVSWFLNFLTLYFSKEQMAASIIPILTNYDRVIFDDDQSVSEAKASRRQAICKIWGKAQGDDCVVSFWDNHINWINEANQKKGLRLQPEFTEIYENQLSKLLQKAEHIEINCQKKAEEFQDLLLKQLEHVAEMNQGRHLTVVQQIQPIKIKVGFQNVSFFQSLKEMKSNVSKALIGSYVVLAARFYAHKKFQKFTKQQVEDNSSRIKDEIKEGVSRLINLKFIYEVRDKINVMTSSKNIEEDFNRMFSPSGKCWIKVAPLNSHFIQIEQISVTRIPSQKEPYECKRIIDKKYTADGSIIFEDPKRVLKSEQESTFEYELHSIKIRRPNDENCQEFVRQVISQAKLK